MSETEIRVPMKRWKNKPLSAIRDGHLKNISRVRWLKPAVHEAVVAELRRRGLSPKCKCHKVEEPPPGEIGPQAQSEMTSQGNGEPK